MELAYVFMYIAFAGLTITCLGLGIGNSVLKGQVESYKALAKHEEKRGNEYCEKYFATFGDADKYKAEERKRIADAVRYWDFREPDTYDKLMDLLAEKKKPAPSQPSYYAYAPAFVPAIYSGKDYP